MSRLLALALVLCLALPAQADQILPQGRITTANDILFGALKLGKRASGKTVLQPDAVEVGQGIAAGGPAGFAPTMAGLDYQLIARRYFTGTSAVGVNGSLINVEGDNASVTGPSFLNVFTVQNGSFGGPTARGGRQAIQAGVVQTAPTAADNENRNYVGILGEARSFSGDGGTNTGAGAKGAYFGMNPVCILEPGATNTLNCSGNEINVAVKSGASTHYKSGAQISKLPFDAVQGTDFDAALSISDQAGASVGWKDGILFGPQNGQHPIDSNGYLMRSYGPGRATFGINALGVISTSYLAGAGARPVWAQSDGTLTMAGPTAAPASATSPCVAGAISYDTGFAYFCVAANTWRRMAIAPW